MQRLVEAVVQGRFWNETRGQDLIEYALMLGFITVAVAATFPPVGGGIYMVFSKLASMISAAA